MDTLLAEIVKLERVKALKLPEGLFEGVPEKVVAGWRARALTTPRPEGRGFQGSRPGVPVSQPTAPGRTRNV